MSNALGAEGPVPDIALQGEKRPVSGSASDGKRRDSFRAKPRRRKKGPVTGNGLEVERKGRLCQRLGGLKKGLSQAKTWRAKERDRTV